MDMINIGYSGASTAQVELNVTAQNTANTMTTGYTRQVAEISTIGASGGSPNSAGNGVQVDSIRRVSNQYQVNQVWYAASDYGYYSTQQGYLTQLEAVLSDDNSSLSGGFDNFFAALNEATTSPDDSALREQVISEAGALSLRIDNTLDYIDSQSTEIISQQQAMVSQINTLTSGIASYNQQIAQAEANGDNASALYDARDQMESALAQLQGNDYNRVLIYLSPSLEPGQTTYEFTDTIRSIARKYYPDGELYMAGDATNEYDFQKSFAVDNVVVNVVSIFIVLLVLLFTFQSVGMPILLIVVIQGAIWINFSFPYFMGTNLYFMGYLIVSSIQMGANIDYAIVIATRFNELKDKMEHKQAMIETINFAFPTILTSGTIMTVSGILIGQMTSDACIVGIGQCLGRGTIISIILVLFVLPQILLIGTRIVDRTSFAVPKLVARSSGNGRMRVNGIVQGEIHGSVAGTMNAIVDGDVQLTVISGNVSQELDDNKQQEVQNEDQ